MTEVRGCRVLIVEDEYLLAQDLSRYFTSMGAIVLGPVSNLKAAREQVAFADAAVLDVDLNGTKVFSIADQLTARRIPFVFFTGREDISIPARFRHVGRLSKPVDWDAICGALYPPAATQTEGVASDDVLAIAPKLRLAALLLMEEPGAADRLVEAALTRALATIHEKSISGTLEEWLTDVLQETHRQYGRNLLS